MVYGGNCQRGDARETKFMVATVREGNIRETEFMGANVRKGTPERFTSLLFNHAFTSFNPSNRHELCHTPAECTEGATSATDVNSNNQ
jgi:hypothetical protein